jgi:hypothetical protein
MSSVRPTLVISTATVLAFGVLATPPAGAGPGHVRAGSVARAAVTTTLGQAGPSLVVCAGIVPAGVLLGTQGANAASYVATSNGVLTSFTHLANNVAGQVRAIVLADGPAANHKLSVAKSPKFNVTLSTTNTFQIRVPIKAGQRLGLGYTASNMACAESGVAGDVMNASVPFDPDVTNDFLYNAGPFNTIRPNISAVLEPDADNDGYGDVTQDACPQSALTQVACPAPETTITKKPKRVRANPRVKVKFVSSIPGSTFQCSIDGRRFKTCTSPFRKRFKVGQHKLRIRAISPVGIVDPKPAKVKFTIV